MHPVLLAEVPQQPSWKAPGNVAYFQTRSSTFKNKSLSTQEHLYMHNK